MVSWAPLAVRPRERCEWRIPEKTVETWACGRVTDCLCRDTRAAELCTKYSVLKGRLADGLDSVQRRGEMNYRDPGPGSHSTYHASLLIHSGPICWGYSKKL